MSGALQQASNRRGSGSFSRRTVLGLVLFGFLAFITMLYFIGAGDTQGRGNNGAAHAEANGLNGYSGLVELLKLEGEDVSTSRSPSGLETPDLLVLALPQYFDKEELGEILQKRAYVGPTMVILPKWFASPFPDRAKERVEQDIEDDWVELVSAIPFNWATNLPDHYAIETELKDTKDSANSWAGLGLQGTLPTGTNIVVTDKGNGAALVVNQSGEPLALSFPIEDEYGNTGDNEEVVFVVEPDLVNNYGLSDPSRAALALTLIDEASYGYDYPIVFDLTLNGFGGSTNLLTLAFRPPFLAATLCLILAMLIVGWRAFKRFGPAAASGPDIAFGKRRLVANGAGLIVKARRLRLLADPYVALSARRLASKLGLIKPDEEAIDDAVRRILPEDAPFSVRAQQLRAAQSPSDILRAARALNELTRKLEK